MWSVISAPVNELTPVCISGGILDLSVCPLTANPCPGTVDSYVAARFGMLVTPNMLYRLCLLSRIFGWKDIKRLRQRPHFFVSLSHFLFLWREGSWCESTLTVLPFLTVLLSHCLICILCAIASPSCSVESWHFSLHPSTPPPSSPRTAQGDRWQSLWCHFCAQTWLASWKSRCSSCNQSERGFHAGLYWAVHGKLWL